MKLKHLMSIGIGTALILAIPLIAMQFTDEVNWDMRDFIIVGLLLAGAGLIYEFISSRVKP